MVILTLLTASRQRRIYPFHHEDNGANASVENKTDTEGAGNEHSTVQDSGRSTSGFPQAAPFFIAVELSVASQLAQRFSSALVLLLQSNGIETRNALSASQFQRGHIASVLRLGGQV